jgi:hypothetical protein
MDVILVARSAERLREVAAVGHLRLPPVRPLARLTWLVLALLRHRRLPLSSLRRIRIAGADHSLPRPLQPRQAPSGQVALQCVWHGANASVAGSGEPARNRDFDGDVPSARRLQGPRKLEGLSKVVFGSSSVQPRAARAFGGPGTPWWYRYVRSWRLRMWIETGIWDRAAR